MRDNYVPAFRVTTGTFEAEDRRQTIDTIADWVARSYRADLVGRPSKHVYVSALPASQIARIDELRDDPLICASIRGQFDHDVEIVPMKGTDELYLSHYNEDLGGDHGLFAKHYDGNLRFLPWGAVVRALIYLRSDGSYRVMFADSGVVRSFVTYDLALLDFHRELHWVEGSYDPAASERIVLKCNFLVVPKGRVNLRQALLAINLGQFYVVKAAMEYSKSPRSLPQRAVGLLCNGVRLLNNVHPLLPHAALLGLPLVVLGAVWAGL